MRRHGLRPMGRIKELLPGRQGYVRTVSPCPRAAVEAHDPMEARVARLEDDMKEVRSDLKAIRIDLAELKGRVASLPTTWQMITLVFGILGAAFFILRFGLPALSP